MPIGGKTRQALNYEMVLPGTEVGGDIEFGDLKFIRNSCPNGQTPKLIADAAGDYLRLCVQKDAYLSATDGEPLDRDRCELRDSKIPLGTAVQYSFDLRIEENFPIVDARMVVAQIKAPYYDANGGSPLFALRFERGNYFATVEHLYETKDVEFIHGTERSRYLSAYHGRCDPRSAARAFDHHLFGNSIRDAKELQVRAAFATNGLSLPPFVETQFSSCTTGIQLSTHAHLPQTPYEWHRFRLCVAATRRKDFAGIVELYVARPNALRDTLIARATGEFGHRGYDNPDHNTGPVPDQTHQYFKIGPYRDKMRLWGDAPASIHVRNVRRSEWPDAEGFYTKDLIV